MLETQCSLVARRSKYANAEASTPLVPDGTMSWVLLLLISVSLVLFAATIGLIANRRAAKRWRENNVEQSDDAFLALCGITGSGSASAVALAIRRSIAEIAHVPPASLPATARVYGELTDLLHIDCADWIDVKLRVERRLGITFADTIWLGDPSVRPEDLELQHLVRSAVAAAQFNQ